jgi:glycosyltransferase involved in cell wall biosynthesis
MMTLYLVVPCYNEEEVLPETARRLGERLDALLAAEKISEQSRVLFVDDGSRDKTWTLIESLSESDKRFGGVKLSRNRGHQNALLAGLTTAHEHHCDAVITLDADLQDDVTAIDRMVDRYLAGCDVVYGVRSARNTDTFFKRATAQGFYRFMQALGVDLVYNHADYRLLSYRALDGLLQFGEVNLFLRGIIPQIGYPSDVVTYERGERFAGESKYPLKKMIAFALDGVTSFSVRPVRLVASTGALVFGVSLLVLLIELIRRWTGALVSGTALLGASLWTLGGLQLLGLGIVGEYVGRIYQETKHRPRFLIEQTKLQ